jgi:plasmid stability protein
MADLLVRDIDPKLKQKIEESARAQGRSMSDEVKAALSEKFDAPPLNEMKLGTLMFTSLPDEFRGDDLDFNVPGGLSEPPNFE